MQYGHTSFKLKFIILSLLVAICFVGCGSSSDEENEISDDFVVTTELNEREKILKELFTETMYNTITEKSRTNTECRESNRATILPEDVQELANGQWYYTYDNLIAGMAKMGKFGTDSDDENINKLEIAAFLANIAQETGAGVEVDPVYGGPGCAIQEGYGGKRDSCEYGGCVNTPGYDDVDTCKANKLKCPAGDIGWCGRGPHQLSWGVNYLAFGEAMGEGDKYMKDPDLLTIHPNIGITGSIWFWGRVEHSASFPPDIPFKPSAHSVVVGKWEPTDDDKECGRTKPSLGIITNIINGGIECGPNASAGGLANAAKRVKFFNAIVNVMGVDVPSGWADDCKTQKNFAQCQSYRSKTNRCGANWTDANTKCGTICSNDTDCSNGEKCFADLSEDPCK